VKLVILMNNQILISQIEEIGADIGEPDCKLVSPFLLKPDKTMEPFLCGYTKQDTFMMSSDKILTLAEPTPTLIEKYEDLIKE
jgi:hypothetical protein